MEGTEEEIQSLDEGYSPGLEIGDLIVILGGRLNKTVGKLYGFSADRFTLQPRGLTDRVLHIPMLDGLPDPELEIEEIKLLKKTTIPGFVNLIDLRAGQYVETFGPGQEETGVFKVVTVDAEKDSAVFLDDAGIETDIEFDFTGVPRDLPYEVIRTRESPAKQEVTEGEGEGEAEVDTEADTEAEAEEDVEFALGAKLELPEEKEIKEVETFQRIYLDVFQRSDLLGQLIRTLPIQQQRDPIKLQEIRRRVELFMQLRNDVVRYGITGEPRGIKPTSLLTLGEVIGIQKALPLAKKIATITKVLYPVHTIKHTEGHETDTPPFELEEGLFVEYFDDILKKANSLDAASQLTLGQASIGMPKFYTDMEKYRQVIQTPFIIQQGPKAVEYDEEVFRRVAPDFENPELNARDVYDDEDIRPPVTQIPYALTRLLHGRQSRFLTGDALRTVEPGEAPSYSDILMFPRNNGVLRTFGPIRSGKLATDISLGMTDPFLVDSVLSNLGSVTEFPTAQGILKLGVEGNILGNVSLKDWLEQQPLVLYGPADASELLVGYGLNAVEWNLEQNAVIQTKIQQTLGALRIYMSEKREENKATLANLRFEAQSVLEPEAATRLLARIESEPLLQKVLENLRLYIGDLASIDINWFSYIYINHPDLLLTVLGQQAMLVAKERIRFIRDQYIQAQKNAYAIQRGIKDAGEMPTENKCPHVKKLEEIRKIAHATADEPRDVVKMKLLVKLLADFRGKTEDNWVWCNTCNQHLLCAHELLNIQEYLRPKEKDVIHKELILKFSGGQFSGKFVCRVCGIAIAELDFDTNMEFDDQGRPMMGRSVMIDKEAEDLDEIRELMSGPGEAEEEVNFGNDELNTAYKTFKTITNQLGINPDEADYRTMLEGFSLYLTSLPSRDAYAAATKGKGKVQDYDIYYSIRYVSAAAAILLLNIQTHIPDYTVYYTSADCKDGFFGYPMDSQANLSGVQCVTTVVAGMNENEFPWNQTTLQKQANLLKRRDALQPFVFNQITEFMKNPVFQAAVKRKREYRAEVYGTAAAASGNVKQDQIAQGFRPIPYILSAVEAAEAPVGGSSAAAWIRSAHRAAAASAALNPDAIFSDTTSGLHSVLKPADFWSKQDLPALDARSLATFSTMIPKVSTTFVTSSKKEVTGEVDSTNFYKLFMDLCYEGENMGLPHELGIGLTCGRCGLNFQENPRLPAVTEADPKKQAVEEEKSAVQRKAHMESQGIEITEDTFYELLNTAHEKASMPTIRAAPLPRTETTLPALASIPSEPVEGWAAILTGLTASLKELGPSPSRIQIATAAQALVGKITEKEEFIQQRLGTEVFKCLESIVQRSPRECGEAVRSYILLPFQRWLTGIDRNSYTILDSYNLSHETITDILVKGMGPHLEMLGDVDGLLGLSRLKVITLVEDLRHACSTIFPNIRGILMPGGNVMVNYIQRAVLMGYIQKFIDPHSIPQLADQEEFQGAINMKMLYAALATTLSRYMRGSRIPTEQEIRTRLEQRAEAEKQKFIGRLDKMNRDERRVALVNKTLGLGEWAVGGTKAIRQYDPERYEAERAERAQAGLTDYVDLNTANAADGGGTQYDMFGFVANEGEGGDGGYDNEDIAEDDY